MLTVRPKEIPQDLMEKRMKVLEQVNKVLFKEIEDLKTTIATIPA